MRSRFLAGRDDYRIVSVDFARDGRYAHVWGLREGWDRRDPLLQELRAAYRSEGYRSYLEANW